MLYRGFPSKLHHTVPDWVESGAIFHIRIALDRTREQPTLVTSPIAEALMESAKFYEARARWYITAFLLMPDHIHALLSFHRNTAMSRVIGDWKHFHSRKLGIIWQEGFFDHRLRDDERGEQLSSKIITFGRIPWRLGSASRRKTGLGGSSAPRSMTKVPAKPGIN